MRILQNIPVESILDVLHKARDFVATSKLEEAINVVSPFCQNGQKRKDFFQLKQRITRQIRSENAAKEPPETLRRSLNEISEAILAFVDEIEEDEKKQDESKFNLEKVIQKPREILQELINGTDKSIRWYQSFFGGLLMSNAIILLLLLCLASDSLMITVAISAYLSCTSFGIIPAFNTIKVLKEKNVVFNTLSQHHNDEYILSTIEKHIEAILS